MDTAVVVRAQTLKLWMNGLPVGLLLKDSSGGLTFHYLPEWIETPGARPISLSLPLRYQPYQGEQVFNYFDNLLPDNKAIRDRIQARFKISSSHPFDLLAAIGMDCVGAVQIAPADAPVSDVRGIAGEPLSDTQIARLLGSYRAAPLGMSAEAGDDFRISLAGVQEKTALLWHGGSWQRPRGPTPTTHILKLPIGVVEHSGMDLRDSCENEWLCLRIAHAFDLPVCRAEIQCFDEVKALVVERFDRRLSADWIMRLPQEDFCQALGFSPNLKYESDGGPGVVAIMGLLQQSRQARQDREQFFKSLILFWLLAAIDGHAKNFSLFIEAEGRFRLTPLYDIMSAYPLLRKRQLERRKITMAMALHGQNRHYRWHTMLPRHFLSTAEKVGLPVRLVRSLFSDMMEQVDIVIDKVCHELPTDFPEAIVEPIFAGMRDRRDVGIKGI